MRFALFAGLLASGLLLSSGAADATVRSFFSPELGGERLSFCLESGEHCGKTVADAWCRANGYDEALLFQREAMTVQASETISTGTEASCSEDSCFAFRQIKCRRGI